MKIKNIYIKKETYSKLTISMNCLTNHNLPNIDIRIKSTELF